jgi:hypothetical protein
LRAQVDPKNKHATLERCDGITDDGEVLEVLFHLRKEVLPLGPPNGWERAILYRVSPGTKPRRHCLNIERVSHLFHRSRCLPTTVQRVAEEE